MNIIFEVKTIYDIKGWIETNWKASCKAQKSRYLRNSLISTFGFALIMGGFIYYFTPKIILIASAIIFFYWLFYFFFLGHYIAGRKGIAKNRKEYKTSFPTYFTVVYDTKIELRRLGSDQYAELPLGQITEFSETKNYFLLFGPDHRIFDIISKAGFTTGDADSFRDFAKKRIKTRNGL